MRIEKILRQHILWLYRSRSQYSKCADLRDVDLSDVDLSDVDLRGADLRGADLHGANLRGADLRGADLSSTNGLIDPIDYISHNFESTIGGIIAYKSFGEHYSTKWDISPGNIISEITHSDRTQECACGINVGTLDWCKENCTSQIYRLLIRWEWLPGIVVPYNTDGKIRCSRCKILGAIESNTE